jgi:hypothetical protein
VPTLSVRVACVTLALLAIAGCEAPRQACRNGSDCRESGFCTRRGDECVAATDEDCANANVCTVQGKCRAHDGRCVEP